MTMPTSSTARDAMASTDTSKDGNSSERVVLVMRMAPFDLEKVYHYDAGGLHPVHLGDSLGPQGRYRVLHKLGNGGFATVWLCRDTQSVRPRYVALKILMAECSTDDCPEFRAFKIKDLLKTDPSREQSICLPLKNFRIEGPNGSHLCFVYPVLGPRISDSSLDTENPDASWRRVALQVTRALATLHELGVCHGDLKPSNVLQRIAGFDGMPEEELVKILGEPRRAPVTTVSEHEHHEPRAPQYLVYPIDFANVGTEFFTDDACIIDFGESFEAANPPEETGIPIVYRAPELILKHKPGKQTDLWALGCTLFDLITGQTLFDMFDNDTDEYLSVISERLGKLPEPLWSTWERRNVFFEEESDELGRVILKYEEPVSTDPTAWSAPIMRSLKEAVLRTGVAEPDPDRSDSAPSVDQDYIDRDVDLFVDLLGKLLALDPEKRPSARELSEHEWFKLSNEHPTTSTGGVKPSELVTETDEIQEEPSDVGEKPSTHMSVEEQQASSDVQVPDQEEQHVSQAAPSTLAEEQETSEKEGNRRFRRHSV